MTDVLTADTVVSTEDIPAVAAEIEGIDGWRPPVLGPNDRLATDQEVKDALEALLRPELMQAHFGVTPTESAQSAMKLALGEVGHQETPAGSNHTKYNDWFADLGYGDYFRHCAWCAIFQCWVGRFGSIPSNYRSAGALALVARFPNHGPVPGSLVGFSGQYFPDGHVGMVIKSDGDYIYTVEGNTGANGQHPDGVWYVHRYVPGNVHSYGLPIYDHSTPVPPHKPGELTVDGKFGRNTKNNLKKVLNTHKSWFRRRLKLNGHFKHRSVRALQNYLKKKAGYKGKINGHLTRETVTALQSYLHSLQFLPKNEIDGSWGPLTTKALQRALNRKKF